MLNVTSTVVLLLHEVGMSHFSMPRIRLWAGCFQFCILRDCFTFVRCFPLCCFTWFNVVVYQDLITFLHNDTFNVSVSLCLFLHWCIVYFIIFFVMLFNFVMLFTFLIPFTLLCLLRLILFTLLWFFYFIVYITATCCLLYYYTFIILYTLSRIFVCILTTFSCYLLCCIIFFTIYFFEGNTLGMKVNEEMFTNVLLKQASTFCVCSCRRQNIYEFCQWSNDIYS